MSKQKSVMVEQEITAPARFIEQVSTEKPAEFLSALSEFKRATRNASRQEAPAEYLFQQASYAWRIYSALNEAGITTLFIRTDNAGGFTQMPASRAGFKADYPRIVGALRQAVKAGIEVAKAEIKTGAKGDYVRVSAVAGIIGVA